MLLGERLGGHHGCRLVAIPDRQHGGEERHDRLPAADVTLQKPVHAPIAAHVGDDLADGAHLCARQLVGEGLPEARRHLAFVDERDPLAWLARQRLGALVQQLDEEQLLEREACAAGHRLRQRRRPMHFAKGLVDAGHAGALQHVRRQVFGDERKQGVEMRLDDRSDDLERQPLGRRIDRQHPALRGAILLVAEIDELARLKLPPMEEAHGAGHEQHVALVDRAVEERLSRPRDLDHAARVAQDGLEDPQSFARGNDSLRDDAPDHGALHPRLEAGDRRYGARVLIAMRDVIQQVTGRNDAKPA